MKTSQYFMYTTCMFCFSRMDLVKNTTSDRDGDYSNDKTRYSITKHNEFMQKHH